MNLPNINSEDEIERKWAKWMEKTKTEYKRGKLSPEARNQFVSLARKFNIDLRRPSEIFTEECRGFSNYMKNR